MITSATSSAVNDDGNAYLIDPSLEYSLASFSTSLTYTTPTKLKTLQIPEHTHEDNESAESKWYHTHTSTLNIYSNYCGWAEVDHEGEGTYIIKKDDGAQLAPNVANSNAHTHNGKTDSVGEDVAHRHSLSIPILSVYVYYHKFAEQKDIVSEIDTDESLDTAPADGNTQDTHANIAYKWRIYYEGGKEPTTNLQTILSTIAIKVDDLTTSYWSAMAYDPSSQYVYALHTSGALVRSTTYNLQTWVIVQGYKNMTLFDGNWISMLYDDERGRLITCNSYGYFGFYDGTSWTFNDVDWMGDTLDYTYNVLVHDKANDMFLLFATNTTNAQAKSQTCLSIPADDLSESTKRTAWSVQTLSYGNYAEPLSKGIGTAFYSPNNESVYLISNGGKMLVGTYTGLSGSSDSGSSDSDDGNYTFAVKDVDEANWNCAIYDEKNKRPFMLGSESGDKSYPLMAYMNNNKWVIEKSDTLRDSEAPWQGMTYITGEDYLVAISSNGCIATSGRTIGTSGSSDDDDSGSSDV